MAILTVRLNEEEERLLARRSRKAGMKKATYVRHLIREEPFVSGSDVLIDAAELTARRVALAASLAELLE